MSTSPFAPIAAAIVPNSTLTAAEPLPGGIAMQATRLRLQTPDGERSVVLRRAPRFGPQFSAAIEREFHLLRALEEHPVLAPKAIACDAQGQDLPEPWIALEFVEGATWFPEEPDEAYWEALAAALLRVHQVLLAAVRHVPLPEQRDLLRRWTTPPEDRPLEQDLREGELHALLRQHELALMRDEPRLLHGDFWPGNVLWREGRLVGVLDWEDAAWGSPLLDLAIARLDACFAFGIGAEDRLAQAYFRLHPELRVPELALWDLVAALRPMGQLELWAGDPHKAGVWRTRMRTFIEHAFDRWENA